MINRARLLRRSRDHFFAWLPALMMGVFALGTWWLVRSAPQIAPPAAQQAPADEPDYFMRDFTVQTFASDGQLRSRITGAQGRHYPATQTLHVRTPRLQAWGEGGELATASAESATAKDDGSEVELIGHARVERQAAPASQGAPAVVFEGERLLAFINDERVISHEPVQITRGPDRFTGDAFEYDRASGIAQLKGRVRGAIAPRR